MSPKDSSLNRVAQLDSVRGIAALIVVSSHCAQIIKEDFSHLPSLWPKIADNVLISPFGFFFEGLPPVLLFFILSGFALSRMLHRANYSYSEYVIRRMCRIWLPYVSSVLISLGVIALFGWPQGNYLGPFLSSITGGTLNARDVFAHLLLVFPFDPIYNFVAWTLSLELRISLLFPAMLFFARGADPAHVIKSYLLLSLIAVMGSYAAKYMGHETLASLIVTFHYTVYFAIGMLIERNRDAIARYFAKLSNSQVIFLLVVSLLVCTYASAIKEFGGIFSKFPMLVAQWIMTPFLSFIVMAAIHNERLKKILVLPLFLQLGKISYSLYLFHGIVLIHISRLALELGTPLTMLVGILLSVVVAMFGYQVFELPSQKIGGKLARFRFLSNQPAEIQQRPPT